jgi:hypothetical protein
MAKIRLRGQQAGKMRRKHGCVPKHDPEKWEPVFGKDHAQKSNDPEKWEPVSRLRAALSNRLHFRLMLRRAKAGRKNYAQTKKAGAR